MPRHRVRLTKPFFLGATEVTVGAFRRFVDESGYRTDAEKDELGNVLDDNSYLVPKRGVTWRSAGFPQTDEHPVVQVSWNDAAAFCQWLSGKEGKTYRLPTEAEWEYACRAGAQTQWCNGDDPERSMEMGNFLDAAAKAEFPHYAKNARSISDSYVFTAPAGQFRRNAFGLYDMHGNAWEWCADWYEPGYYAKSPSDDPLGPDSGQARLFRGGSWLRDALLTRSDAREWSPPNLRGCGLGFRVAMAPPVQAEGPGRAGRRAPGARSAGPVSPTSVARPSAIAPRDATEAKQHQKGFHKRAMEGTADARG